MYMYRNHNPLLKVKLGEGCTGFVGPQGSILGFLLRTHQFAHWGKKSPTQAGEANAKDHEQQVRRRAAQRWMLLQKLLEGCSILNSIGGIKKRWAFAKSPATPLSNRRTLFF
jgi:hypothetical protein